jgi:hypothetical protein
VYHTVKAANQRQRRHDTRFVCLEAPSLHLVDIATTGSFTSKHRERCSGISYDYSINNKNLLQLALLQRRWHTKTLYVDHRCLQPIALPTIIHSFTGTSEISTIAQHHLEVMMTPDIAATYLADDIETILCRPRTFSTTTLTTQTTN